MSDSVIGPEVFKAKLEASQVPAEAPASERVATCPCGSQVFLLLVSGRAMCGNCGVKLRKVVWGNVVQKEEDTYSFRLGNTGVDEDENKD